MTIVKKADDRSRAYWCGWYDGRYGDIEPFTENRRLAEWDGAYSRLDYYRGHRAGSEARRRRGSDYLEAS